MIGQRIRLILLAVVIVAGCLLLFYRLWFLQIENQETYIAKQPVTATAKQRVPGVRGRILDRAGIEFARNETNMEIGLDLAAVEAAWKERERAKPRKERRKIPTFEYGPRKEETTDIVALLNETVFSELNRLKLYRLPASDAEKKKQQDAIILSYVSNKGVIPFPYEKNLLQADEETFKRFTAYAENAPNIPGLTISERPKRRYPLKAMAGHLMGYIRENRNVLPADEKKAMDKDWEENRIRWHIEADDFGVAGLELSQDEKLRPKPGERVWLKNEHGRLTDEIKDQRRDPLPGADVFLSLDANIQMIAEMALRDAGVGRGAVVVMNPNNGQVYAMASVPSMDPGVFIPPQDTAAIEELYSDPTQPIFAKALRADTPGSTFKVMTALAASLAGKAGNSYNCAGFVDYGRPIACWIKAKGGSHGTIGLEQGLKVSCNCFFMKMGNDAGIDRINKVSGLFGFGEVDSPGHTGIEVPDLESNGYTGSKTWWASKGYGAWTPSETAYISMGQGLCVATPLQIAMLAAAIGNGGKVYQPTLIDRYEEWQYDRDGRRQKVITEHQPVLRADLVAMGAKARDIEHLRDGMKRVVNDKGGTGSAARSELCLICGKTGTAQKKGEGERAKTPDNRTWFMAFAPYDAPKLAVSVVVVNGEAGGKVSAPIAKRVIERTLGLWAGTYKVKPEPLEPAKGHFNKLDQVVYEGENVPVVDPEAQDEDSTGSDDDNPEAAAVVAAHAVKDAAPKARIVEEDDTKTLTRQTLQPVQFRSKNDPPNPPRAEPAP